MDDKTQLKNEQEFVEKLFGIDESLNSAQEYIKATFGVSSRYDDTDGTLYLWEYADEKDPVSLATAKEYITEHAGDDLMSIKFGRPI